MNDQPAFSKGIDTRTPIELPPYVSIRCRVATACLQGLLTNSDDSDVSNTPSQLSRYAITCADELLKQLEETK